jgi:peptide/nickel transport system permease protein
VASYLVRRFLYSIVVLWGVVTMVFFVFRVLPVDHARRFDYAQQQVPQRPVPQRLLLQQPVLQQPVFKQRSEQITSQYWLFLKEISPVGLVADSAIRPKGRSGRIGTIAKLIQQTDGRWLVLKAPDLGRSYKDKHPVSVKLADCLPRTLSLLGVAMFLATIFGLAFGVVAALKKGTALDSGAIAAFVAGVSIPSFLAALILAYVFGYLLSDFTGLSMTGSLYEYDNLGFRHFAWENMILPAIALSIRPMAIIAQSTRSALLDVLAQDYIRMGYAKGLSKSRVFWKHALPNALSSVLMASSGWLAEMLVGALFIEFIFDWKGIGKITVDAIQRSDFPMVMGGTLFFAMIFIVVKLVMDVLHGLLDPRVRQ